MTARDLLHGYSQIKRKVRRLQEKKEELRTIAESCTVDPTQEKVQASKRQDPMGDIVAKISEVDREIEETANEATEYLNMLDEYMNQMDNEKEWQVLVMKYFKRAPWYEIADTVGVSTRYALTLHNNAIKSLQKIIDKTA